MLADGVLICIAVFVLQRIEEYRLVRVVMRGRQEHVELGAVMHEQAHSRERDVEVEGHTIL